MEPEEIDKLFRDKLAGRPVLPSPEAWARLQQQMEPPKKERTMWIYYAAASVVVVLMAGLLYFRAGQQPAGPVIATAPGVQAPAALSTPAETRSQQAKLADAAPAQQQAPPVDAIRQNQEQVSKPIASQVAAASRPQDRRVNPRVSLPDAPIQLAKNDQIPEKAPEKAPQPSAPVLAASQPAAVSAAPDLSLVEVKVQRSPDADEEPGLRENLNRKGQLLKNIYKQARNLKNGDPVHLAAIGVNEGRIQEETKELKQKISNVISL